MMNKIIYLLLIILSATLASCEQLGPVSDIEPEYVLTDESAFTNASSTEAVLRGVYQQWRRDGITQMRNAMFQLTRTTVNTDIARAYEFKVNDVSTSSPIVRAYYEDLYRLVNQASSIITFLPNASPKELSYERKQEIIGEAYFNRGLANFMLLRSFGEFWDETSPLGIVLYDSPVRENKAMARSSVKDCYTLICSDLENAIKLCPDFNTSYYANKIAAKAIRAKVALYQKDYPTTISLCKEIEQEATAMNLGLEETYSEIFSKGYDSKELLFAVYTSYPQEIISKGIFNDFYLNGVDGTATVRIADELIGEAEDGNMYTGEGMDPRYSQIYQWIDEALFMGKYPNNVNGEDANPYYIIRLAEIDLIRAEAEYRMNDLKSSRTSLKRITDRAGYPEDYVANISDANLPLKIFQHKYIELNAENYEEWFDMVRYNLLDGIDFTELRYIRSYKHKCLPIPYDALAGNNLLVQNPDYVYE